LARRGDIMLACQECNREECADYFIIHNGKVLCLNCAIQYMIHRLEKINETLKEIERRLEYGKNRKG
jgi:hypothetical protein